MATTTSVPRFLLPQRGLIWRRIAATLTTPSGPGGGRVLIRFASNTSKPKDSKKPLVLEKPERFNPPSHGARLPRKGATPKHYGGNISEEEFLKQQLTEYPGMMAPEGSFMHRFWTNPWIHTVISITALTALASWTYSENLKAKSPYYDMIPSWSELFSHPITSGFQLIEVIRLNSSYEAAKSEEKRQAKVDDVAKRLMYRRAHGLPDEVGFAKFKDHPWNQEDRERTREQVEKARQRAEKAAREAAGVVDSSEDDGGIPAGTAR